MEAQSSLALLYETGTKIDERQNQALCWYLKAQLQQINRVKVNNLTMTSYAFTARQT